MHEQMTPYDQAAWDAIHRWRAGRLSREPRRLVPARMRNGLTSAGKRTKDLAEDVPKAAEFERMFTAAVGGFIDFGSRVGAATLAEGRLLAKFRDAGHPVEQISDIAKLELCDIDKIKPNLTLRYASAGMVEGAAAGFAAGGGALIAAGGAPVGAGAGAAPGIGMVAGVMATDAAAVLLASTQAVAHTAAYYGYDVSEPEERVYALGVLGMGTASQAAKSAAYAELNKLVHMLARRATWEQLNHSVVTRVIKQVFTRLGYRLTQRKLGQALPVVGTVVGAGVNAKLMSDLIDHADNLYRERFLRDKYGLDAVEGPVVVVDADEDDVISIADVLTDEEAKDADGLQAPDAGLDDDEGSSEGTARA